jgi:hypothetical protein
MAGIDEEGGTHRSRLRALIPYNRAVTRQRVIVLGGHGNFGARICRALAGDPAIEVVAASRNPASGAKLDRSAPDFARALREHSPAIVIHCAGPFQGQDYLVASAAIAAGAHYIDLADGREFVARFAERNDAAARAAGVLAVSGASSVPALSSAVIDDLSGRFRQLEEIRIAIAPGQRAARGAATIAAVFSYAGRRFQWMSDGAWRDAWGWQGLKRIRFEGLGTRWAAACDVPDLELLPVRYRGVRTVEFHAALEVAIQHFAIWIAAALRRAGVPLPFERWAAPLDRIATLLDAFGSERGAMLVGLTGRRHDGTWARVEWHLTADANHGPEIPCMAAILLARKLARGEIADRGAHPCMGFLRLAEFEPEFARWKISAQILESAA